MGAGLGFGAIVIIMGAGLGLGAIVIITGLAVDGGAASMTLGLGLGDASPTPIRAKFDVSISSGAGCKV